MRKMLVLFVLASAVAFACAFVLTVWPTRYTHSTYKGHPLRIDRVSGEADVLTEYGWSPLGHRAAPSVAATEPQPAPVAAQPQVATQAPPAERKPMPACPPGEEWRRFGNECSIR